MKRNTKDRGYGYKKSYNYEDSIKESRQKDLALITSLILDEDILGGTIFQTFDKAYSIAEKFQYIYPPDFKWEGEDLEFDEAIIKFAKSELEKEERIKEKEYYMKIGNTSGTID